MEVAAQDRAGDEGLRLRLEVALHRARAVDGVEAVFDDVRFGRVGQLELQLAVGQTLAQAGDEEMEVGKIF